jgi:hypothetical protein
MQTQDKIFKQLALSIGVHIMNAMGLATNSKESPNFLCFLPVSVKIPYNFC